MKENTLTRKELLAYAKLHYPVGTKFIEPNAVNTDGNTYIVNKCITKIGKSHWVSDNYLITYVTDINGIPIRGCGKYLYNRGKWATIISKLTFKLFPIY